MIDKSTAHYPHRLDKFLVFLGLRFENKELYDNLGELESKIRLTEQLSAEEKINYRAEVRTIQSQLSKQSPDKSTVLSSWEKLKQVGSVASLVAPAANISLLITKIFGLTP